MNPHQDSANGSRPRRCAAAVNSVAISSHQTPEPQKSRPTRRSTPCGRANGRCSARLSRLTGMTPIGARWIQTVGVSMPKAGLARYLRCKVSASSAKYINVPAPRATMLSSRARSRVAPVS
ncbi:MAG: hypothetical protein AW07_00977 [Candidatus Accumulibacter sp. SK-11]|nr:MAG: hypothetical protein AW07_00977 [Candidatus Accumulibacter sp. SK-11]